jgi:hypothetical protein
MGVVCRARNGEVKSVELLDLWEARTIYKREIPTSELPVQVQVDKTISKLQYAFPFGSFANTDSDYWTSSFLAMVSRRFTTNDSEYVYRLKNITLKKTKDAFEVVTPNDCKIEQIARYNGSNGFGEVYLNQDLVDKMDATNQAALYLHEALYAMLRPIEKTSLRIRRMIGLAFSTDEHFFSKRLRPTYYYECTGGTSDEDKTRFLVVWNDPNWEFHAMEIAGYRPFWGTYFGFSPVNGTLSNKIDLYFDRFSSEYTYQLEYDFSNISPQLSVNLKSAPKQSKFKKANLSCVYRGEKF